MSKRTAPTWFPARDHGLHVFMYWRSGYFGSPLRYGTQPVYGAIYLLPCINGLSTLYHTNALDPIRAVLDVLEQAMEGCICSLCRPLVEAIEDTHRLRLVGGQS